MTYLKRDIEPALQRAAESYPVVVVTGPRQSGKTTIARRLFPDKQYLNLEELDVREFAEDDPRGFLDRYAGGAIFDEIQRAPHLLSYLQPRVDENPAPGRFILTGSQQLDVIAGVTQTLAGRVSLATLLPLSISEMEAGNVLPDELESVLFTGCYPPVYDRAFEPGAWYSNYTATYVERDVRTLINVRDLNTFQRFLRMCAARTGQLLNLSSLANDAGVTHNTAKAWISVLEASFVIHLLPPHFENFSKRLVKTPKLYFVDTGLLCSLLYIEKPEELSFHTMRGPIFESFVISEFLKDRFNQGKTTNLYFWRDRTGTEIDLVIDRGSSLDPVEIKAGRTINRDFFRSLRKWAEIAGDRSGAARLIYAGETSRQQSDIEVLGWRRVARD